MITETIIGSSEDCLLVNNKCKNCNKLCQCDFNWVYKLASAESDLLGYWNTADMKKSMRELKVLTTEDKLGFCHFHPAYKAGHTTVYHICVKPEARGKHIGKDFVEYLHKKYLMPIQTVCIDGSSSDRWWSSFATLNGHKYSKSGTLLNIYIYGDDLRDSEKETLW